MTRQRVTFANNLVGCWPLDDGDSVIADHSGNQLHGALTGSWTWTLGTPSYRK